MIWTILALWLTFQLGAIVGYLIALNGPKPRRKSPIPPNWHGATWKKRESFRRVIDEAA